MKKLHWLTPGKGWKWKPNFPALFQPRPRHVDDLHLIQLILTEGLSNSVLKQREGEYEEVWGTMDKAAFQTFPVAENCYWEQIQWNYKPVFI